MKSVGALGEEIRMTLNQNRRRLQQDSEVGVKIPTHDFRERSGLEFKKRWIRRTWSTKASKKQWRMI